MEPGLDWGLGNCGMVQENCGMDLKACGIGLRSYYMEHGRGELWDRAAAWSAVSAKLENMIIGPWGLGEMQ